MHKKSARGKIRPAAGKVLVIDDEQELLALIKELLEAEGYRVFCAASGAEGINLNAQEDPDLIILDLRLPGLDGIETLRQIRQADATVRVIILTGYRTPDSMINAAALRVSGYLSKPFEREDLLRAVGEQIRPWPPAAEIKLK